MTPSDYPDLTDAVWRKAQASDNGGGCLELADLGNDRVALRDSKNPTAPAHIFTKFEIACFLDGAKKGEFDDLAG
jgi:Domain of unknown function (DUF397)